MSLIERYILAVTEKLPEDIRYDVAEELRSNIEDMLPENAAESEIREVLERLGNPAKLAQEYNPTKRYLIGPALYDSYFSVLKTVVSIVVAVVLWITVLDWVFKGTVDFDQVELWKKLFTDSIEAALSGGLQAALWVTVVFAIMERSGVSQNELPFAKKKWSLDELPTAPVSKKAVISRGEIIVAMFFTILFTALLYLKPQLIAVYINDPAKTEAIPLFNTDRLHVYIPAVLLLALVQLCVAVWKFVQRRWTVPLAVAETVQGIAGSFLVIVMFNDRQLFNRDFFSKIADMMKMPVSQVIHNWFWATMIITVVIFAGITIWHSVSVFNKCKK
jgi:hypothetical protein